MSNTKQPEVISLEALTTVLGGTGGWLGMAQSGLNSMGIGGGSSGGSSSAPAAAPSTPAPTGGTSGAAGSTMGAGFGNWMSQFSGAGKLN